LFTTDLALDLVVGAGTARRIDETGTVLHLWVDHPSFAISIRAWIALFEPGALN
jgi:hypothetical protein